LQADDAAAAAHFERASGLCPGSIWLWLGLGEAQQARAAWPAAVAAYEQALRLQPANRDAQTGLAQARAHLSGDTTP
jgi:cytochrome c-type biogenesis protein CcmH/NrfG